ncbi:MAG: HPr family phosphocarrier protein [Fuerstiella sp.]|nr:HPr family phosphocarrier protein [Fuerstiella sp.]
MSEVTRKITLGIVNGLHLAPISRIVKSLSDLDCQFQIEFNGRPADARSASDLMLLAATHGAPLTLLAQGKDAKTAVETVVAILESPEPPRQTPLNPG